MPSNDMPTFRQVLSSSKSIIAVAGAGLSAGSGIPTFRGTGGMWRKFDAMSLATPVAFSDNPSRVWQFYHYRREKALKAKPNAAHVALAKLSISSLRHMIAPESTFTLITQNVDGLSKTAMRQVALEVPEESKLEVGKNSDGKHPQMLEMHGSLFDVICTSRTCQHREADFSSPICPALGGTEEIVDKGVLEPAIEILNLPHCSKCHELARPGVVWFGEIPHHLQLIDDLVEAADLCLVVGTSSTVYPAASYANEVQTHRGKVAVFNLERSSGDQEADFLFLGPCEETLPKALEEATLGIGLEL